jgi:hypothetical protein
MYLFVNTYSFTHPKTDIEDFDVVTSLENLSNLFIELKKINVDLIIHQSFSQTIFLEMNIREYIQKLPKNNINSLLILLSKTKPFCSDTDTSFEENDSISFDNCMDETKEIEICYTFLSCALYYSSPILTINNLCSKKQFLKNPILVECDTKTYSLNNVYLIPYNTALDNLKKLQKENLEKEYYDINDWKSYKAFVNDKFKHSKITDHCINELSKRYSYSNSYAVDFRNKVKRIEDFISSSGGNINTIDFNQLSKKHYSPESDTRFKELKKSHPNILNYLGEKVNLNWHTWVQDCRMYFEIEEDYICHVHYEKKIG